MNSMLQELVILLPVLLISMSIHEMMHAYASNWLGDDTARLQGRLSLNPLHHIDPFFTVALPLLLVLVGSPILFGAAKPVQVNFNRVRYGEFGGAIIGMIGPLTNLFIAVIVAQLFRTVDPAPFSVLYDVFRYSLMLNLGLFVFNSIPWPPLDGSRLLYAFAPRPLQELMEGIERLGINGLIIFIFVFYQFLSPVVGSIISSLANSLAPGLVL